jgi:hypothetical protein
LLKQEGHIAIVTPLGFKGLKMSVLLQTALAAETHLAEELPLILRFTVKVE